MYASLSVSLAFIKRINYGLVVSFSVVYKWHQLVEVLFFFTKKRRLNFFTKLVSVKQMSHILEKNTRKKNRKTISEQIPSRTYSIFIDNLRKNTFRSYWLTYIDIDQYRYSFFINYHLFSYASDAHDYQIFIQKTFELTCVDLVAWSHRSNV